MGIGLEFEASQTKDKMKIRNIAIFGATGVAALALIGAGAAAVFTATTTSSQTITAGTLNGNVFLTSDCAQSGDGTANLTLTGAGPVGSSFKTAPCLITVHNNSGIDITYTSIALTATNDGTTAGQALQNETYACFYGVPVGGSTGAVGFNESVPAAIAQGAVGVGGPIPAGTTDTYYMVFYAGTATDTGCGGDVSSYSTSTAYPQVPGTNSAAASLNTDSEGGAFTPTLSLTYSG